MAAVTARLATLRIFSWYCFAGLLWLVLRDALHGFIILLPALVLGGGSDNSTPNPGRGFVIPVESLALAASNSAASSVTMRHPSMIARLFQISAYEMLGCFSIMIGRVLMIFRSSLVELCGASLLVFGHKDIFLSSSPGLGLSIARHEFIAHAGRQAI